MGERKYGGWIGEYDAELVRAEEDRLMLRVNGHHYDLVRSRVDHRFDDGVVRFTIADGNSAFRTAYHGRGPTEEERRWDRLDVTADEPWTWEDGDFGEFVFHIATATGPIKYRHKLDSLDDPRPKVAWSGEIDEGAVRRAGVTSGVAFEHRIPLDELEEITAKFEVSGVWAPLSILVFRSPCCVTALAVDAGFQASTSLASLRTLPGWDAAAEGAVADAIEYAERPSGGPETIEEFWTRRERPVWRRPGAPTT